MRYIRTLAPGAATLALIIVLAACGQTPSTQAPSEQPSAPAPSAPTESDSPAPAPSETPDSSPIDVVEHDLPMIGRPTEDGVEVRTEPRMDAPPLTGEGSSDPVILDVDDLVTVTLGPVFAEGESWYEVNAADGSDVHFAFGWVLGDQLTREGDMPEGQPDIEAIHGQGDGGEATADVLVGTPVTVRVAALPMPDAEECEIDVTLIRSDELGVNVATDTLTDAVLFELGPNELSSLFQEEAGTVRLQVDTDCSFAATLTTPAS